MNANEYSDPQERFSPWSRRPKRKEVGYSKLANDGRTTENAGMSMSRDEFWATIEAARKGGGDASEVAERLRRLCSRFTPEKIVAYLEQQNQRLAESHSWPLWGAAYLINGGCSDDGFDYFRGWLLAQGRKVFERVLADPDALAEYILGDDAELECEDMIAVAAHAYKSLTGEYPTGVGVKLPDLGESWDFDDDIEMQSRYPRIWAKLER